MLLKIQKLLLKMKYITEILVSLTSILILRVSKQSNYRVHATKKFQAGAYLFCFGYKRANTQ